MDENISFFKKMKTNNYVRIFAFSFSAFILSYSIMVLFAIIEYKIGLEILLYVLFIFYFIFIYYLFQKKYIKGGFSKKNIIIPGLFLGLILLPLLNELNKPSYRGYPSIDKPIIYLYPEKQIEIDVKLRVKGKLIADYPKYDQSIEGWKVVAYPDGKIIENGKEYSYLFWEAEFDNNNWNMSEGFIVEGKEVREFLVEKLSYMGLTPKEYNEFIVYWYPKMMNNKYNLIHFAGEDYEQRASLDITPKPDSILRVFMVIKPLEENIQIDEQKLEKFDRKGFSVVEWGGTILD